MLLKKNFNATLEVYTYRSRHVFSIAHIPRAYRIITKYKLHFKHPPCITEIPPFWGIWSDQEFLYVLLLYWTLLTALCEHTQLWLLSHEDENQGDSAEESTNIFLKFLKDI